MRCHIFNETIHFIGWNLFIYLFIYLLCRRLTLYATVTNFLFMTSIFHRVFLKEKKGKHMKQDMPRTGIKARVKATSALPTGNCAVL